MIGPQGHRPNFAVGDAMWRRGRRTQGATRRMTAGCSLLEGATVRQVLGDRGIDGTTIERSVVLLVPLDASLGRSELERRVGAPGLRGLARYRDEDLLAPEEMSWEAEE